MAYFPMYVNIEHMSCLIIGGGRVAVRKVKVLLDFGAHITVIAPDILPEIMDNKMVVCVQRNYLFDEIKEYDLVIAATDDERTNHEIALECNKYKIPINAVDQIEDCSFIFPSYVKKGEVVAAFSSSGQSPVVTQYLKQENKKILTDLVGDLADFLGAIREEVQQKVETENERKKVFQEILRRGLEEGKIPADLPNILKSGKDE